MGAGSYLSPAAFSARWHTSTIRSGSRASSLRLFDHLDRVVDVLRPEAGLHDEAQRERVADRLHREVQHVPVRAPELARRVPVVEAAAHLHDLPAEEEVVLDGAADRLASGG